MSNDNIGNVDDDMVEESHVRRMKKDAYYVASTDGPGLILTTVQLRGTEKDNNYAEWARAMRMALRSKKNAIYGTIRSHMIQQEPIPKLRTVLAQICKEEQHKNSTRIGDYSSDGAAFTAEKNRRSFPSKFCCTYCKRAGHDVTGCFQLVGYPKWWPQNSQHLAAGRGLSSTNNNKACHGGRSGRGGRQQPQPPRTRATDGGRPLEVWANSASVRQGRSAADMFRDDLLVGEEDSRGPGGPIHSNGPNGGPSTSSSGPGSNGPGPGGLSSFDS
ncbi:hypothetical protein M9H77_29887 [Catharanthus roseus]|uniref:Uncharacterized protein n=1 Tax=Catharanthus roseus TaxID=4058 RepID=A0ACB9ZXK4_CATRO|nr:hypothetical protein M9H77_29887 [Catharanthus roseus]